MNLRRPNFPGGHPPSIIGAKELNYCVRDGNRWNLLAIVTGLKLNNMKYPELNQMFKFSTY